MRFPNYCTALMAFCFCCLPAFASEIWLQPGEFDGQDQEHYSFLRGISDDPGKYRCLEVSPWKNSADPELKQIYLQALESTRIFPTSEKCVADHQTKSMAAIAAVCVPSGEMWAKDYILGKCVPVSTDCGPGIRPRGKDKPQRFFLAVYSTKKSCEAAKRGQ